MSEPQHRHIEHREELDDFIGIHPSWLLRSGISITALFLVALFCLSYFIQYPDKIVARGILSSENPPIEIKSKVSGVVEKLFIQDQSIVAQNDPLLYIKNTASSDDIQALESFIKSYQEKSISNSQLRTKIPRSLNLGGLQSTYGQLTLKVDEYDKIQNQGDVTRQVQSMENEIANISKLNSSVDKEKNILQTELNLVKADADRANEMFEKGILSAQEKEQAASKLLQYQQKMERLSSSIISNYVRIERLRLEQIQLEEKRLNELKTYEFEIAKLVSSLNSNLAQWKDDFYLVAPASGKLSLNKNLVVKKNISQGESIGFIVNKDSGERFIQVSVPAQGIGKVQKGNEAIIKFDAYPHKEFGVIEAAVADISLVPIKTDNRTTYEVQLAIPETLTTTYNRELPFQANTSVTAEIITKDQTVLERIFNQFSDLIKN